VEIDLGEEMEIANVLINEYYPRTREFTIEARTENKESKTIAEGKTIGCELEINFEKPIKTRYVRLNIISATDVPTINEFQIFR
jgi:hypothetical protein